MKLTEADRMSSDASVRAFRDRMRLLRVAYDSLQNETIEALRRSIERKALEENKG